MESLSITQIFGAGAFQNENNLVIQKSSLLKLTPKLNNTAESLLIAILITASRNFQGTVTDELNRTITNQSNQSIFFDNSEAFELIKMIEWKPFRITRNNIPYICHQIIIKSYAQN
ncbi:hypothetical protein H6G81_34405 [Scytonema hofmannii FACHB-248]|uniref:Uncharacterized protein n=1 Tax=Scytonema hofmannii FACHB-248 TaxID=1842502 RepID=A0ABR8H336_9CYAN|nr:MULTISPECIES: hypothetical protein [Nostocales]MBD2609448.1 hypothetical protein [Scytonema hofmannii FACHB-248]